MNLMKPRTLIAALMLSLSLPAFALSLDEAKSKGLVGEQSTGYLGVVSNSPSAEVKSLVQDINTQRKALYIEKAKKAGVEPQIMELRTGERLLDRAAPGEYVRTPDGRWVRK
ncbi:YdbL family protein [Marinobacterium sp. YM272]|uniref:YdbL family protein n=1 Tax=Marinobacterium sp. YM272 TaxID=3421654 RepID=UPI003D7FECC7